jgi:hypothetical protein
MLQASTRPAMVPGWRRWPSWSPYAAMVWSANCGTLALGSTTGARAHSAGPAHRRLAVRDHMVLVVPPSRALMRWGNVSPQGTPR